MTRDAYEDAAILVFALLCFAEVVFLAVFLGPY